MTNKKLDDLCDVCGADVKAEDIERDRLGNIVCSHCQKSLLVKTTRDKGDAMNHEIRPVKLVGDNYERCEHGSALKDGAGEILEPPCECRWNSTSAETQLTGPERIFIQSYDKYAGQFGYFYFSPDDFAPTNPPVEYVRADLAINESPKTEVESFRITYCGGSRYMVSIPNYDGGEVVRKTDYDSLAHVNSSLVAALKMG